MQFVTTDEFRGIKIQEIYQVLGEQATQDEITNYVQRWFLNGGLAGIGASLLATSANVGRIEAGQVVMPDAWLRRQNSSNCCWPLTPKTQQASSSCTEI